MKTHVSLNVTDLNKSVEFYTRMLGVEPAKLKSDYAKFDVANPPLNLALNESQVTPGGQLSHLGLQVGSTEEVVSIAKRWEQNGLLTLEEMGTDCCYALQDKVWVTDPDGAYWEVFTVLGHTEGKKISESGCCDMVTDSTTGEETCVAACC